MKTMLALLLSLPFTVFANAENLPAPASSTAAPTAQRVETMIDMRTQAETVAHTSPRDRTTAAADFKADLAYCRTLAAEERRGCERETHAARAEGLYR